MPSSVAATFLGIIMAATETTDGDAAALDALLGAQLDAVERMLELRRTAGNLMRDVRTPPH